jgi:hypothetical protein
LHWFSATNHTLCGAHLFAGINQIESGDSVGSEMPAATTAAEKDKLDSQENQMVTLRG